MLSPTKIFQESSLGAVPIRDLQLAICGTRLEPIIEEFRGELQRAGIHRLRPHFYLSTEWGVPFDTVSIAIPFYLARPDLTTLHNERGGYVEGASSPDITRYLRHEMGHVVNYAYRLYDREDWIKHFGPITQPYHEDYRAEPFSRRYVSHLPGWYAQKHPDEDWAETFAVWLTPGLDWRISYADRPLALAKLEFCARIMTDCVNREPLITTQDCDEDVAELPYSLDQFYGNQLTASQDMPPGLDGALRAIFDDHASAGAVTDQAGRKPASTLIRRLESNLVANVYRWTSHAPERTQALVRHLASRADQLGQVYQETDETAVIVALTALMSALAMNHVLQGHYLPGEDGSTH